MKEGCVNSAKSFSLCIEAEVTPAGEIILMPNKAFDKAAFFQRIEKLLARMPMTQPVVEQMRHDARY